MVLLYRWDNSQDLEVYDYSINLSPLHVEYLDLDNEMHENPTVNGGDVCNRLFSIGENSVSTDGVTSSCASFEGNQWCKASFPHFSVQHISKAKNIMTYKLAWSTRNSLSVVYYVGLSL